MKKVSIIIPNYNGEKYINKCLKSVIEQNYKNKEIIIIDDGSTDKSIQKIDDIINKNLKENIKLIKQNNLNASIARNEGLKNATGDYVIFLDSDDYLQKNIIEKEIEILEKTDADLLIGNYDIINEDDKFVKQSGEFNRDNEIEQNEILNSLASLSPVPSNKVYRMENIKKNNLYWGNVKIGQDLNFYLKYLSTCKKVYTTTINIYKYRVVNNSITRTYNFKIFDIASSFDDVKKFYKNNGIFEKYEKYLAVIELNHYNKQMSKQKKFKQLKAKKLIIDYFSIQEKNIDYSKSVNYNKYYKRMRIKFKIKTIFKYIYIFI